MADWVKVPTAKPDQKLSLTSTHAQLSAVCVHTK